MPCQQKGRYMDGPNSYRSILDARSMAWPKSRSLSGLEFGDHDVPSSPRLDCMFRLLSTEDLLKVVSIQTASA